MRAINDPLSPRPHVAQPSPAGGSKLPYAAEAQSSLWADKQITRYLHIIIRITVLVSVISAAATWLLDPSQQARLWAYLLAIPSSFGFLVLLKRGHIRITGIGLFAIILLLTLSSNLLGKRPYAIGVAVGLLVIVMAAMFATRKVVLFVIGANIAFALVSVLYWVNQSGKPVQTEWVWIDTISYIILSIVVGYGMLQSASHLNEALQEAQTSRQQLLQQNLVLEQRVAERTQQLAASESYYRSLIQSTNDLIVIIDLNGLIHFESPSILRLLGYSPNFPQDISVLTFVHPNDAPPIARALLHDVALPDLSERRYEMRVRHADGSWRHMEAAASLLQADPHDKGQGILPQDRLVMLNVRDITERKLAEAALEHRIAFEKVIADVSRKFVRLEPSQLDEGIAYALETVGRFTEVDVCRISEVLGDDNTTLEVTHEWLRDGVTLRRKGVRQPLDMHNGWWLQHFLKERYVQISVLDELPAEMQEVREALKRRGLQSVLLVPLFRGEHIVGLLGLDTVQEPKFWTDENLTLLQILAEIIGNALERKRAATALLAERDSLEVRVAHRTHELSKLLEVSQTIGSTLKFEPLLTLILQKLNEVVAFDAASVSELHLNTDRKSVV